MTAPAPIAALRSQLLACQRIMASHGAAMSAIRAGERAATCPLSPASERALAAQIEDLLTATA